MTTTEATRFVGYLAGVAVGLAFVVYGLVTGDVGLAVSGAATLGVSVTAAPNVNRTAVSDVPDEWVDDPDIEQVNAPIVSSLEQRGDHAA